MTTAEVSRQDAKDATKQLPEGWRRAKLGEVCTLVGDSINPLAFSEETFAHYSIPAFDASQKPAIEPGAAILSNKVLFPKGVVLFSKLNPRIPRVWFVANDQPHRRICSTEFLPLRPDSSALDPEYLTFVLQEPELIGELRARVQAATKSRERLRPETVLTAEIPLPSLAEQKRIARILTEQMAAVEAARRSAEAQLEAADALPAAYLRAVFNSPEAKQWPKRKVGDVCQRMDYGYTASADFSIGEPRFLRITDIQNGRVSWDKVPGCKIASDDEAANSLADGDIVFARTGATTGKSFLIRKPPRAVFASYLIRLRAKPEANADFMYAFFQSDGYWQQIRANARGAGQPNVNATLLAAMVMPLPTLADQRRIVAQLSAQMASAERLRATLAGQLEAIRALPAALLRRAFSGEI